MADRSPTENKVIVLKRVRLSFPNLFQKAVFDGKPTKYTATLLLPKGTEADPKEWRSIYVEQNKLLKADIKTLMTEKGYPNLEPDRLCLSDGDNKEYDGYKGCLALRVGSNNRPNHIKPDKTQATEEDGLFYAGCHVDAAVTFWFQNNQYGKRVNCNIHGLQFRCHGDPLSGVHVDTDAVFETIEDDASSMLDSKAQVADTDTNDLGI